MNVRPSNGASMRWPSPRRLIAASLRWAFITIGAITAALVLFSHLYSVNETIYDPSLFAIGVGGLFAIGCGIMLMAVSRIRRQRMALRLASRRCEELADCVWELKEAEERATSLIESQGDLIVRRDRDGRVTYANDAFCRFAGASREALAGTAAALAIVSQGEVGVLDDGTRVHDQEIMTTDGPRWVAWREVMMFAKDGRAGEMLAVGRDITARVRAERALAEARDAAEAASRAKSRFLATVSHEFRTPLNGILGMTALLADTSLTPEQVAYVKAARSSGDALLSLIEDMLDFSKIEAGKLELQARPFALLELVEEVVELLGPRAQAKGLAIACDVDERLPGRVMGDAARLRQVLLNLAGNAIKFTERGGIAVIVEAGGAPDQVMIAVRDTGIGIAREEQDRIFLEFEQADGSATRQFGGTGLGLAISRRIVERMGGSMTLESEPGQGATFHVSVPMPAAETHRSGFTPPDLTKMSILIVAAEPVEASLLARRLSRWGATIRQAEPGDAVRAVTHERFDAMLVDAAIGDDAACALAQEATGIDRRLVMITPAQRSRLDAFKRADFSGYLVKPARVSSLAARLTAAAGFDAVTSADTGDSAPDKAPHRSLSILVAEDNEINALLTRAMLTKLGHRPTVVASGHAAVDAWEKARAASQPYDAVLMDLHMPGLDGLAAAQQLRQAEAEHGCSRTPVIALTANALPEDRIACLAAGMDDFLVKPLDRRHLGAALGRLPKPNPLAA